MCVASSAVPCTEHSLPSLWFVFPLTMATQIALLNCWSIMGNTPPFLSVFTRGENIPGLHTTSLVLILLRQITKDPVAFMSDVESCNLVPG